MAGIGEALRSTRERRGLSIDEVARETRISPRFLEALEAEQFDELPAPVYVRGFLRSYASYLKIEPQPLLDRLVGGDVSVPAAPGTPGGRQSRPGGAAGPRKNDPFQRRGVISAPRLPASPKLPTIQSEAGVEGGDDWSPEPLAPFTAPHQDHGYVPGSDLMESPEYAYVPDDAEFEPRYGRGAAGILAERQPRTDDPRVSRSVALFAAGLLAVLALLGIAVVMTGGGGDDEDKVLASGALTPGITPGSVIPVGTRTAAPEASSSAAAAADATALATAAGTPGANTTAEPTAETASPTPSATTGQPPTTAPTAAPPPTATPVPPTPAPEPTPTPLRPESSTFGECTPTAGSYDCGSPPYRVICYAPIGVGQNRNWWVDADRSFGSLPEGWKEFDGLQDNGDIINAGQSLCAS